MVEFVETTVFTRRVTKEIGDEELGRIQIALLLSPSQGALIPKSGGIRKMRWGAAGKGKRGGWRIIYYLVHAKERIYLLYGYRKAKMEGLSRDQVRMLRKLIEE